MDTQALQSIISQRSGYIVVISLEIVGANVTIVWNLLVSHFSFIQLLFSFALCPLPPPLSCCSYCTCGACLFWLVFFLIRWSSCLFDFIGSAFSWSCERKPMWVVLSFFIFLFSQTYGVMYDLKEGRKELRFHCCLIDVVVQGICLAISGRPEISPRCQWMETVEVPCSDGIVHGYVPLCVSVKCFRKSRFLGIFNRAVMLCELETHLLGCCVSATQSVQLWVTVPSIIKGAAIINSSASGCFRSVQI